MFVVVTHMAGVLKIIKVLAWEHWTSLKKDVFSSELMVALIIGAGMS
jgi:hypothetical protein